MMHSIRLSKQKSFHSFKTKGVRNFKAAFDLAFYVGCHAKIMQLLLNSYSAQKLSATFIYLNFLTNVPKIIKGEVHSRMAIYFLYANKKFIQKYVVHQNFSSQ